MVGVTLSGGWAGQDLGSGLTPTPKLIEGSSQVTLKVEGKIVSDWVSLLEKECLSLRMQKKKVLLDLSDITYVDESGVEMLNRIISDDIEIARCSSLIKSLLNQ